MRPRVSAFWRACRLWRHLPQRPCFRNPLREKPLVSRRSRILSRAEGTTDRNLAVMPSSLAGNHSIGCRLTYPDPAPSATSAVYLVCSCLPAAGKAGAAVTFAATPARGYPTLRVRGYQPSHAVGLCPQDWPSIDAYRLLPFAGLMSKSNLSRVLPHTARTRGWRCFARAGNLGYGQKCKTERLAPQVAFRCRTPRWKCICSR